MSLDWKNILPSSCDWCPLNCGADRVAGNRGLCGADDKLIVARSALHFWEEPPISGIIGGPDRDKGPGSGTIFFSNCNMKCVYCQNSEISGVKSTKKGQSINCDQLVDLMLDLQNQGAMNINLVTATHYRSLLISAIRTARNNGLEIPILWNSSGYETVASIYALSEVVDVWLPDFKYSSNNLCEQLTGNPIKNYVEYSMEAIEAMLDIFKGFKYDSFRENARMTSGIIVRHLLLPGRIENSKQALKMLFENFGNEIKYSIMNQYTPVISSDSSAAKNFPYLLASPTENEYEELLDFADSLGIEDYYWQKGGACKESFIPEFSSTVLNN